MLKKVCCLCCHMGSLHFLSENKRYVFYFQKQRGIGKPYRDSAFVFCQMTDSKWIVPS